MYRADYCLKHFKLVKCCQDLWDGLGYLTDKNEFAQAIDVIKHVQYKQNKLK